jgi:hypothetical protein
MPKLELGEGANQSDCTEVIMGQPRETDWTDDRLESQHPGKKKRYEKPAFRYERVFETRALSCGKVDSINFKCHNNMKNS